METAIDCTKASSPKSQINSNSINSNLQSQLNWPIFFLKTDQNFLFNWLPFSLPNSLFFAATLAPFFTAISIP